MGRINDPVALVMLHQQDNNNKPTMQWPIGSTTRMVSNSIPYLLKLLFDEDPLVVQ